MDDYLLHADVIQQDAAAYATHYSKRDLPAAFELYRKLIETEPRSEQADYARMQIQNIVKYVVPKQELLNAQTQLVLKRFENQRGGEFERASAPSSTV